jgi:hypothetical protein
MTTTTLMIILNVVLDVALLGGLGFVMSRAAKLEAHRPGVTGNAWRLRRPLRHSSAVAREERARGAQQQRLRPALDRS